ncbi:DUF167 domain-containing protein [Chloroflexota bacterium]
MIQEQANLVIQVQPNSSRNEVLGFKQEVLHIKIATPPLKGKANKELINYLSKILGIAKSQVTIQKGATSKRKMINISGLNREQIINAITEWMGYLKSKS